MLRSKYATRGAVVAPHHLAAQTGLRVLQDGGNAIEAMVAAAAAIAVLYPHMNSVGGDGFWLVGRPGEAPIGIDACGPAAARATRALYAGAGLDEIPCRGPLAALTVAGTVDGWRVALEIARARGGRLPLARLLEDAAHYARSGFPVTQSQAKSTRDNRAGLCDVSGFRDHYLPRGIAPQSGDMMSNPALAATIVRLASSGLDDFYRGDVADAIAQDLGDVGSPIARDDLERYRAQPVQPLSVALKAGTVFNLGAPTQGLVSLMILGLFDRLEAPRADGFHHVHMLVEATKLALGVRDKFITDPDRLTQPLDRFLEPTYLDELRTQIDSAAARPWGRASEPGDTVWLGAIDKDGLAVSFIQSVYWEFGSGVVLPRTGILWQNRGIGFSLKPNNVNALEPGRKPFHTLNPALAHLKDGRTMVYGAMGGEGQPQTQAAVFTRYASFAQDLQEAITRPRWLLGRTWGAASDALHVESGFPETIVSALRQAGHDVRLVERYSEMMGHAGALVRHPSGPIEMACDPRSDGGVAAW